TAAGTARSIRSRRQPPAAAQASPPRTQSLARIASPHPPRAPGHIGPRMTPVSRIRLTRAPHAVSSARLLPVIYEAPRLPYSPSDTGCTKYGLIGLPTIGE